jgi:hypothetical protein
MRLDQSRRQGESGEIDDLCACRYGDRAGGADRLDLAIDHQDDDAGARRVARAVPDAGGAQEGRPRLRALPRRALRDSRGGGGGEQERGERAGRPKETVRA